MKARRYIKRGRNMLGRHTTYLWGAAVIVGVAAIGAAIIHLTHATTSTVALEAEAGAIAAGATIIDDPSSSGGKAVKFGNAVSSLAAPTNLVAYTGGNSIALRWSDTKDPTRFKQYNILRNGTQIGTVTSAVIPEYPELNGMGFVDKSVKAGVTYKYKVQSVDTGGNTSPFSSVVSATQPNNMAVPTVNVDTTQAADLTNYMQTNVVPLMQVWYPKIAKILTGGNYAAPKSLQLVVDPAYSGVAYTSGTVITAGANYVRSHPGGVGVWVHESVHTVQKCGYENSSVWVTEGMADWIRYYVFHDYEVAPPPASANYTDGYGTTAYFFNWIITTHNDPNFVQNMNLACYNGTYTDTFFNKETGTPVDQLWSSMQTAR